MKLHSERTQENIHIKTNKTRSGNLRPDLGLRCLTDRKIISYLNIRKPSLVQQHLNTGHMSNSNNNHFKQTKEVLGCVGYSGETRRKH